jgi:hypothetical protein
MREMREKDGELLKVKCITARRTAETGERGTEEESDRCWYMRVCSS